MPHRLVVWLVCVLLTAPSLLAQQPVEESGKQRSPVPENINDRFLDPQLDPKEWLGRFEIESREVFAHRQAIIQALRLSKGARVADVGSGTGLFLQPFSEAVAETGRVYAIDISPRLVRFIRQRAREQGLNNVRVVLSTQDSVELPQNSVDLVFLCDTYHHFEYHHAMLRSLAEALDQGGQLILIDFERIPGKSSEWLLGHVRAGKEQFKKEIQEAGFEFVEEVKISGFKENYFLRFQKPQEQPSRPSPNQANRPQTSNSPVEARVERLLRFDENQDGTLDREELMAWADQSRRQGPLQGGRGDRGERAAPGRGGDGFGLGGGSELDKPPLAGSDRERRILAVLEELSSGPWYANVSPADGRFLRQLTVATRAQRVVELGTSSGYSSLWFALAVGSTGGHLYTHELDPERIKLAQANFEKAGVEELITIIPGNAHETVKQHTEPIDLLFLDADKEGYVDYLDKLLPLVREGGLILAHNMRRPAPDPRYLEAITTNPNLDTSFVLMDGAGIAVTLKKHAP